ncbi:glycosyl transferase family 1 [Azospirillum thiophilum]|uniref:Glycosyl transferase family 1 n=1 Tax=Azospirillum thiophilum TaxID=528244 RepID=A0AAC8W3Z8_9PROT|nr:glycosyltransferase family 4 protein [Azospirillum thiophilum]ALG74719.1 glycosyl transferase family 1 [Azospirillum thiophilum]KJR61546.1 glycosyl transferase family 1 [Azospirillum thiophilum]
MRYLFIHQNSPGQYRHVVRHLASRPGNRVVFVTQNAAQPLPGVEMLTYQPFRQTTPGLHHYLLDLEAGVIAGQMVHELCLRLKREGFTPDLVIGHNGWGETLYIKDVWPDVPLLAYFEFFYRSRQADVGFDPAAPLRPNDGPRLRTKNVINLLGADAADWGQTPTAWQWSLYPPDIGRRISVIHEGVDTRTVTPDPQARLRLPCGRSLTAADEVVTYVARNLEPYRGFPEFMRALPGILRRRPAAQVVVIGGDEVSYGPPLAGAPCHRERLLAELGGRLDTGRVHFLGQVPYGTFLSALRVSSAHVYLTYPFVLSWSMLEAMAAGCTVVGSATPPVAEVVRDGENGRLVDFFDTAALTDAVVGVLGNADARAAFSAAARRTVVERYDLTTVTLPRYLDLLDTLRDGRVPPAP